MKTFALSLLLASTLTHADSGDGFIGTPYALHALTCSNLPASSGNFVRGYHAFVSEVSSHGKASYVLSAYDGHIDKNTFKEVIYKSTQGLLLVTNQLGRTTLHAHQTRTGLVVSGHDLLTQPNQVSAQLIFEGTKIDVNCTADLQLLRKILSR